MRQIPVVLTGVRALLAPVAVLLAVFYPSHIAFGTCLVVALLSDIFDGILARRLNVATPNLRRLDSIADTIFYVCIAFAAWYLYPSVIADIEGLAISMILPEWESDVPTFVHAHRRRAGSLNSMYR